MVKIDFRHLTIGGGMSRGTYWSPQKKKKKEKYFTTYYIITTSRILNKILNFMKYV